MTMRLLARYVAALLMAAASAAAAEPHTPAARAARVLDVLRRSVCESPAGRTATIGGRPLLSVIGVDGCGPAPARTRTRERREFALRFASTTSPNGTLLGRERLAASGGVALDLLAYASDGLVVGGITCYPDNGLPHSTIIHVHGGMGGIFVNPDGNMLQTCLDWAGLHQRTAFAPSLRGEDGGEGQLELCLGEADDVAAGATLMRSLEVTDPSRVALVGGSIGGCVVLRAAALIPGLRATVALVPPTDWKALVAYHRTAYTAATETNCDGTTTSWNIGGPAFADALDGIMCGHPQCTDAVYNARSPIPGMLSQSSPTLIVSAMADNVVPFDQQVLWSVLRSQLGYPVSVFQLAKCDPGGTPPPAMDVALVVANGFHLLSTGSVDSALAFLLQQLDLF